jgi:hypothetical protein
MKEVMADECPRRRGDAHAARVTRRMVVMCALGECFNSIRFNSIRNVRRWVGRERCEAAHQRQTFWIGRRGCAQHFRT